MAMLSRYRMGCMQNWRSQHYTTGKAAETLPFVLTDFGRFHCDSHYYTERQGFSTFLFLGTHTGCGELRCAGKTILLPAGKAAVFSCAPYQYYGTSGDNWDFFWFHFNGAAASGFIRFLNGDSIQAFDWDASRDCFEELERLAASPTRKTDLQLSLWVHTLLNDLAAGAAPPSTDPDAERITEAAAYLRENCAQSLTIEEIARKCNLSKFHFIRVFRRFTGWTPYEYLTLARISEAKSLLTSTSLGLSEIAARTGYADAKSLIRVFRQHTGITPAGYRKQFPVYENSRHDSLFGKPG